MGESTLVHLLIAALGALVMAIGWGLPRPDYKGSPSTGQGIGLLVTILLFMLGIFLLTYGIQRIDA